MKKMAKNQVEHSWKIAMGWDAHALIELPQNLPIDGLRLEGKSLGSAAVLNGPVRFLGFLADVHLRRNPPPDFRFVPSPRSRKPLDPFLKGRLDRHHRVEKPFATRFIQNRNVHNQWSGISALTMFADRDVNITDQDRPDDPVQDLQLRRIRKDPFGELTSLEIPRRVEDARAKGLPESLEPADPR